MANSWSFLHDEMNMSNQDYWYEDGFSLTGNPAADSPDTITYSGNAFAETMHIGAHNQFRWIIFPLVAKIPFPLT